jgi:RHS repeat-associated protein
MSRRPDTAKQGRERGQPRADPSFADRTGFDSRSGRTGDSRASGPGPTDGIRDAPGTATRAAPSTSPASDRPLAGLSGQPSPTGTKDPALPNLALPKAGGAIRSIGEKFDTDAFTGTASFTVPIAVSPGRGGFQPDLALRYDSGSGNGPFGLGWTLGVPSVRRKTSRGLPQYGPDDSTDVFLFASAEDLVPRLVEPQGSPGKLVKDVRKSGEFEVTRYLLRTEGSFSRIERWRSAKTGDTHWQVTDRNNVTSLYGTDATCRIADLEHPERVFEWLLSETRDDRGNVIQYEYRNEDDRGIDNSTPWEANRFAATPALAQRYLHRIRYGNRTPFVAGPKPEDWLFEVVFDYGDGVIPANGATVTPDPPSGAIWPARPDAFSDGRAGFEVRTWRCCRRVLMFHRFSELDPKHGDKPEPEPEPNASGPSAVLVASTDFEHDESPVATQLRAVRQTGYIVQDGKITSLASLPPVTLTYVQPATDGHLHAIRHEDLGRVRGTVDGAVARFTDLDGEGLPGILLDTNGTWHYARNLGAGRFAPAKAVDPMPGRPVLAGGATQLLDLGADGRTYAVDFAGSTPGYYVRTDDRAWEPHRTFDALPRLDWQAPELRMLDLNGDGFADILRTDRDWFEWYPSKGREGFERARRVWKALNDADGPRLVFADASLGIYTADMTGDGLPDLVRIGNGSLTYWPNLGHGRFGRKVTLGQVPVFDAPDRFDQGRIRLADVDGSGTTDVVYLGDGKVTVWFNQAGNRLSAPTVFGEIPEVDSRTTFSVVDLLGTGTSCLVWSSPLPRHDAAPVRYVDVLGGRKPYLLERVDNGRGLRTDVTYKPSTHFYLQAEASGQPWVTRLPFPVQVVEKVETWDRVADTRLVRTYTYAHGCYDHDEREFRGFGRVDELDAESFSGDFGKAQAEGAFTEPPEVQDGRYVLPPVLTRRWFHTGVLAHGAKLEAAYAGEFYTGDAKAWPRPTSTVPAGLDADVTREAWRALRGQLLREEVYALDASDQEKAPYVVKDASADVRLVQPRSSNPHTVFLKAPREERTSHHERNPADPRVAQALTLEVDAYGVVLESAMVSHPRRTGQGGGLAVPEQHEMRVTVEHREVKHEPNPDGAYRLEAPLQLTRYELTGLRTGTNAKQTGPVTIAEVLEAFAAAKAQPFEAVFATDAPVPTAPASRRLLEARSTYCAADGAKELPFGQTATPLLPCRNYVELAGKPLFDLAFGTAATGGVPDLADLADRASEALLTGGAVVLDGAAEWWGRSGRATYDPARFFQAAGFESPYGAAFQIGYDVHDLLVTSQTDPKGNQTTALHSYRALQPFLLTDPNGNRKAARYDALGVLVATAVMGKAGEQAGDWMNVASVEARDDDQPTSRVTYSLHDWTEHGTPVWVRLEQRETHHFADDAAQKGEAAGGKPTRWLDTRTWFDGTGREAMRKTRVAPGDAPVQEADGSYRTEVKNGKTALVLEPAPTRYVGTGRTVFDNKGNPVKQYEPFFTPSDAWETEKALVELGVSPVLRYDPLGRLMRTDHPDGTYAVTSFDPWQQTTWDRNDTVLGSRWYTQRIMPLPQDVAPSKDWIAQNRAAQLAARHADTPTTELFDVLGQTVATVQRPVETDEDGNNVKDSKTGERIVKQFVTRTALDIDGHVLSVTDPRGLVVERNVFDRAGNVLWQQSPDAGPRWSVTDLEGQPLLSADARGYMTRQSYDKLRRPTLRTVQAPGSSTTRVAERRVYGEEADAPEALNLRLQQALVLDDAGSVQAQGFDFAGRPVGSVRRFAANAKLAPEWKDAAGHASPAQVLQAVGDLLENEANTSTSTWNALGKPVDATTPDGSTLRTRYDESGAPRRIELRHRGAVLPGGEPAWTPVVPAIEYDAHGRRERVSFGNQTSTGYTYDPESFRLTRIRTTDQRGVALQELHLVYDPQGNVVERWDAARDKLFFANQVVEPRQTFVLDALYRLVLATGRESATPRSPIDPTGDLAPRDLPEPNAGAVVPYTERYAYDRAGNLVSMSHQSTSGAWTRLYFYATTDGGQPASNRLASVSVAGAKYSYPHDAAGNVARMPSAGDLQWNAAGLLERATLGASFTCYDYGQDGLRARKHRVHTGGMTTEVEQHGAFERHRKRDYGGGVQDETELLSVSDGTGVVLRIETRVMKGGALPGAADAAPVWRYELADALGSPTVQVNAQGAVIARLEYAPYGALTWHGRADKEGVATSRYRFNGKAWDEETGLVDYGARLYSPWLGRWTAVDPAGLVDGPSRYAYVRGNPGSLVDPDGRQTDGPEWYDVMGQIRDYANRNVRIEKDNSDVVTHSRQAREYASRNVQIENHNSDVTTPHRGEPASGNARRAPTGPLHEPFSPARGVDLSAESGLRTLAPWDEAYTGEVTLRFDRESGVLQVDSGIGTAGRWSMPAQTGRPGATNERLRGKGPIPRGEWTIDVNEISDPGLIHDFLRNRKGDWGDWRVRLHASEGTKTHTRTDFFLHGGSRPGSGGCIDIGGGFWGNSDTTRLLRDLRSDADRKVQLRVD